MLRALVTAFIIVFATGMQPIFAAELAVVCMGDQKLAFYDPDTGELIGSAATGKGPRDVVVTPDNRRAWVSDFDSRENTMSLFDVRTHSLIKRVEVPNIYGPRGMVITADGKSLYVTFEKSRVVGRLDPTTGEVLGTIAMGMKGTRFLVLSPDESRLFAANVRSDNISIIDLRGGEIERHMLCGDYPEGMAVSPDGKTLWVASQGSNDIRVIDITGGGAITATIPNHMPPARLAFTPDGGRVIVTCPAADQMFIYDASSHEIIENYHTKGDPFDILLSPNGKLAYVGMGADDLIAVLDLETLEFVREFPTMKTPLGMAYID